MTEPSDIKTRIMVDGSSDHSIIDLTEKRSHWNDFFDMTKQHQVGENFVRDDQLPAPDRNIDWDEVFGTEVANESSKSRRDSTSFQTSIETI